MRRSFLSHTHSPPTTPNAYHLPPLAYAQRWHTTTSALPLEELTSAARHPPKPAGQRASRCLELRHYKNIANACKTPTVFDAPRRLKFESQKQIEQNTTKPSKLNNAVDYLNFCTTTSVCPSTKGILTGVEKKKRTLTGVDGHHTC